MNRNFKKNSLTKALLDNLIQTLLYLRVRKIHFTLLELYQYLINFKKKAQVFDIVALFNALDFLVKKKLVIFKNGTYTFNLAKQNIQINDKKISLKILKNKIKYLKILTICPWVRYLGVIGTVALGSANRKSDLDVLIIAKKKRIWTTRLFMIIFLELLNIRRNSRKKIQRICLNTFYEEDYLKFLTQDQDYYMALELGFMIPVLDKADFYFKILEKNQWFLKEFVNKDLIDLRLKDFKSNAWLMEQKSWQLKTDYFLNKVLELKIFDYLEKFLAFLQKRRIQRKIIYEKQGKTVFCDHYLIFQPKPKNVFYTLKFKKFFLKEKNKIKKTLKDEYFLRDLSKKK